MLIFILELISSVIGVFGFYFYLCEAIKDANEEKDFELLMDIILIFASLSVTLYPWLT